LIELPADKPLKATSEPTRKPSNYEKISINLWKFDW